MIITTKAYTDDDGNTYRVEQATNRKFVTVRINAGGNSKRLKIIAESGSRENAQKMLDAVAEQAGWKEVAL